jgi:hypothetical protein
VGRRLKSKSHVLRAVNLGSVSVFQVAKSFTPAIFLSRHFSMIATRVLLSTVTHDRPNHIGQQQIAHRSGSIKRKECQNRTRLPSEFAELAEFVSGPICDGE